MVRETVRRGVRCAGAVLAILAGAGAAAGTVGPGEYFKSQPKPVFRPGNTMEPLTRYGWSLPLDARIELAENWGYCLEYGGYATAAQVEKDLADPKSVGGQVIALAASDPKKYRLAVICSRELPTDVPPETWARDADGRFLDGKAQSLDGTIWDPKMKTVWSPEAPNVVLEKAGALRADPIRKIRGKCPIAIVLNGGEYALNVLGFARKAWELDPRIQAARGETPWFDYISSRKARQELIIADAVRAAVPDRRLYIYYTCGGGVHRNRYGGWGQWAWGYEWMKPVSDLPSSEAYYRHFNDGWTGNNDILTMSLNARAFEIANGMPLSYNWLCGGWPRESLPDGGLSDIALYTGFLKCLYTAGMIGGNAGYYAYPKGGFGAALDPADPPHWVRQMIAFSHVHALFSHLEEFLRKGDLLPGPEKHRFSKDMPACEFPTGEKNVRVLGRKLREKPEWLVTAWAADGTERDATVAIPDLGSVTVRARACGSVYRAVPGKSGPVLTLTDPDGLAPTVKAGK